MIFNTSGKFIRNLSPFTLGMKRLSLSRNFVTWGLTLNAIEQFKNAANILNEKGNKALRPLMNVIDKFKIPPKTAIKLFHTYIYRRSSHTTQ